MTLPLARNDISISVRVWRIASFKRKSSASRLAEVLDTNECPACGTGLDRVTNRHGGHLSLCNSPACPVRLAFPATETIKERYYFISSTEEFDFTKV